MAMGVVKGQVRMKVVIYRIFHRQG